jgi:hypothetical protein
LLGSDAVQYARLAEEGRASDAKAWHNISVSIDAEDVKVARFEVLKFSAPVMAHFDEHNSLLCRFF